MRMHAVRTIAINRQNDAVKIAQAGLARHIYIQVSLTIKFYRNLLTYTHSQHSTVQDR